MWELLYIMYILNKINRQKFSYQKIPNPFEINNKVVFRNNLRKYIGQTITIFVIGGGYGGSGYTGILMDVKEEYISIYINYMSLAEIPISKIACFTHNIV